MESKLRCVICITLAFLLFAGISVFCWVTVFRSSTRRKFDQPGADFWRLSSQGREDWDAMSLASSLILAMVFSLITIVFLVVGIYRLFAA